MENRVQTHISNGIARVELNRPDKLNSLDLDMFRAIVATQRQLSREKGLRAVVLSGRGEDFSSGLDVKSIMGNRSHMVKLLWKWHPWKANLAQQVSTGWSALRVPVIAALHGRCWGGGMQIALGADLRIAHPEASLSIMEGRWGLIPDMGGLVSLRRILPYDQALKITLTAESVTGLQALELGLVTAVDDDPQAAAQAFAELLLERSPDAVSAAKKLYRRQWNRGNGRVLAKESLGQVGVIAGKNQRIAVRRQRGDQVDWRD